MSPVNSMFVCIKKKNYRQIYFEWPISIIVKMLNIGADNRSTPTKNGSMSLLDEPLKHLYLSMPIGSSFHVKLLH